MNTRYDIKMRNVERLNEKDDVIKAITIEKTFLKNQYEKLVLQCSDYESTIKEKDKKYKELFDLYTNLNVQMLEKNKKITILDKELFETQTCILDYKSKISELKETIDEQMDTRNLLFNMMSDSENDLKKCVEKYKLFKSAFKKNVEELELLKKEHEKLLKLYSTKKSVQKKLILENNEELKDVTDKFEKNIILFIMKCNKKKQNV